MLTPMVSPGRTRVRRVSTTVISGSVLVVTKVIDPVDSTTATGRRSVACSGSPITRCSGRRPTSTLRPGSWRVASGSDRLWAISSATVMPSGPITPGTKFIAGEPMKPATNLLTGRS